MKWKTAITEIIGCEYPILSAAFARQNNTKLVAAVSKAGGCGVLTGSYFKNEEKFRKALLEIKNSTNHAFAINFSPFTPGGFQKDLSEMFFPRLQIANEEQIKTIITAGPRCEDFGKKIKEFGMNWIHKVTTMRHAEFGEKMGADAIILTGLEGGGFKNPKQNTLLINMVNADKRLKVPIIASGGISNGKGMLMALISGAQAVHLCTTFLATEESPIGNNWKQNIIDADSFDPEIIKNVCHFESNQLKATPFSLAAGTIDKILPVEEVIKNIIKDAETLLRNLGFKEDLVDFTKL
jgi:NAD(P)H-dependent flavin oxidoreductase YrpB (nitropropane dioxygenase family)